jgi:hypothetical protein
MHKFATQKKDKREQRRNTPTASESLVAVKSAYEKLAQALDAAELAVTMEGVKAIKLHGSLLSNEARQPWVKIVQAQTTKCPREDICGFTHDETPTKTGDSFMECITFHLQQVFKHDADTALKYYITKTLRKPNQVPTHQFFM